MARSEELNQALDAETVALLRSCYEEAKALLLRERTRLEALAKRLLETELDRATVLSLLGERPAETHWGEPPGPPAH